MSVIFSIHSPIPPKETISIDSSVLAAFARPTRLNVVAMEGSVRRIVAVIRKR